MSTNTESPLRRARKAAGKTVSEVAGMLGMDQSTLSRIELGQQTATPEKAEQLARFFGTVSEIEILYPERFTGPEGRAA